MYSFRGSIHLDKSFVYGCLCTVEPTPLKEVGLYEDHQLKSHCNRRLVLEFHADPTSRDC